MYKGTHRTVCKVFLLATIIALVRSDVFEDAEPQGARAGRSISNIARLLLGGNVPPDHPLVKYPDPIQSASTTTNGVVASVPGMAGKKPEYSPVPSFPKPVANNVAAASTLNYAQQPQQQWQLTNQGYPPLQHPQLTVSNFIPYKNSYYSGPVESLHPTTYPQQQQASPSSVNAAGHHYNAAPNPYNAPVNTYPAPGNPYNAQYSASGRGFGSPTPANGQGLQGGAFGSATSPTGTYTPAPIYTVQQPVYNPIQQYNPVQQPFSSAPAAYQPPQNNYQQAGAAPQHSFPAPQAPNGNHGNPNSYLNPAVSNNYAPSPVINYNNAPSNHNNPPTPNNNYSPAPYNSAPVASYSNAPVSNYNNAPTSNFNNPPVNNFPNQQTYSPTNNYNPAVQNNYNPQQQVPYNPQSNYNAQVNIAGHPPTNYNSQPANQQPVSNYNQQPVNNNYNQPPVNNYNQQPVNNYNQQPVNNYNQQPVNNYNGPSPVQNYNSAQAPNNNYIPPNNNAPFNNNLGSNYNSATVNQNYSPQQNQQQYYPTQNQNNFGPSGNNQNAYQNVNYQNYNKNSAYNNYQNGGNSQHHRGEYSNGHNNNNQANGHSNNNNQINAHKNNPKNNFKNHHSDDYKNAFRNKPNNYYKSLPTNKYTSPSPPTKSTSYRSKGSNDYKTSNDFRREFISKALLMEANDNMFDGHATIKRSDPQDFHTEIVPAVQLTTRSYRSVTPKKHSTVLELLPIQEKPHHHHLHHGKSEKPLPAGKSKDHTGGSRRPKKSNSEVIPSIAIFHTSYTS